MGTVWQTLYLVAQNLGNILEMTHICGAAGEKVALQTRVPTNTEPHVCLSQLGESVRDTLRDRLQECSASFPEQPDKDSIRQWVEAFPSQCVLAAFAIHSTKRITHSLRSKQRRNMDMRSVAHGNLAGSYALCFGTHRVIFCQDMD